MKFSRFLLMCSFFVATNTFTGFVLITSLYNEKIQKRLKEYIYCLEKNCAHGLIDEVHVIYDTSKDTPSKNKLLTYLKDKDLKIKYIKGRPSYGFCFDLANTLYPDRGIILSNADIYFDETLHTLEGYDLTNKFLALTRWEKDKNLTLNPYQKSKKGVVYHKNCSQDSWIFTTPIKMFPRYCSISLGTPGCDNSLAYVVWKKGLHIINPCLTIKCHHKHDSGIKHYSKERIYSEKKAVRIPFTKLNLRKYPLPIPY